MNKLKQISVYSLVFILAAACSGKKEEVVVKEDQRTPVKVLKLEKQNIAKTLEYNANLVADEEVFYAPASPGRIEKIYVEVGDQIKKGQLLVEMDQTQLIQAEVQYLNQKAEFNRAKLLDETGSISKQNYDALEAAYKVAKANYDYLKDNTKLLAPFNGVVTGKYYENGEMYMSSPVGGASKASIITIQKINPLKAYVSLSESYYPSIAKGTKVSLRNNIFPDKAFDGSVNIKYPTVDPSSRTFTVEVKIPNNEMTLRPGMFGSVNFFVGETDAIVVPALAVLKLQGSNQRYVFLNNNGKAKRVEVTLGRRFDDQVEIVSDQIQEGDELIVVGQARLIDGSVLNVQ
ncbi:MAG: efflux RND transporter periplasmic adaptor subunit [Marinifilaceae bacterium]